jgi:hypothetical protein
VCQDRAEKEVRVTIGFPSGWLPNELGPIVLRADGVDLPARGAINFKGFAVTDNPANDELDIDQSPNADDLSLLLSPERTRRAVLQTADATQQTLLAYTMTDETLAAFDLVVTAARRTNVTKAGRFKRSVVYRRTGGGAPTIVGAIETGTDQTTDAWLVTVDVSGNDVRVRVTGAAATGINWSCSLRIQETLAT